MPIFVSNDELAALLQADENDVLDFKSGELLIGADGKDRYKIAKHLVGFANHRGGKLVFGVNDEGEPEGVSIFEEEALSTLSEIVSSRTSPPVEFTHSHFSSEDGDLSEGSILVVDVIRSSSSVPPAIIELSHNKIRKREYRIRTGESTRLVSNDELRAMFEKRTRTDLNASESLRYLLNKDYIPANTKFKPRYQSTFDRHFSELGTDEEPLIEKITGDYGIHTELGMERIRDFQYAIVLSCILAEPEFMNLYESNIIKKTNPEIDSLSFDLRSFGPSDIVLESESNPLISETAMEKPGLLPDFHYYDRFQIPDSATIKIWEDFKRFDIYDDGFRISFSVEIVEVGVGFPESHPDSSVEAGEYGLKSQGNSGATMLAPVSVDCDFEYPNQEFAEFESYRAYCDSVIEAFERAYDWDSYIESLPDTNILELEAKIDEVLKLLKINQRE